jgi:hypothetical protein
MATARWATSALAFGCLAAACLVLGPGASATNSVAEVSIGPPSVLALRPWTSETANTEPVEGEIEANGKPVAGVRVRVDNYVIPTPTDAAGHFIYLVDDTLLERHVVTIADATNATVGKVPLTSAQRSALAATSSAITVAYPISGVKVSHDKAGNPVITGKIADVSGAAPPHVALSTYELTGTVTDSNGKPVVGAQVSTRTVDRDYWTVSSYTDKKGRYSSLFTASDEEGHNPVPFTVRVADGNDTYQFLPAEYVFFKRLESATLDLQLPPSGYAMALPLPKSFPGAIYEGTIVGATTPSGKVIKPLKAQWVDGAGNFSITLPRAAAGKSVSLWEDTLGLFSVAPAVPGGPVEVKEWPRALAPNVARDLQTVSLS